MFNNIKLIDKAFDKLFEIEKKVNYEYEPMYYAKGKGFKRNLFFKELKKDFVKDVTEFGFCPYIPKVCKDQQKNKNIFKFAKIDNYSKLDYIKSLYKQINPQDELKEKTKLNFYDSKMKKINRYSITSNRMRRNKSSLDVESKRKKKIFFLKKISEPKIKLGEAGVGMKIKLKKIANNFNKKNASLVNICYKKNKNINQSDNEFIDAESFVYEPEKMFFKHNKNYYQENSLKDETTNVPKSNTIINKSQKKKILKALK